MESSKEEKHCYVNSLALPASKLNLKGRWSSPTFVGLNGDYTGPPKIQQESKNTIVDLDQVSRDVSELEKHADGACKQSCYKILNAAVNPTPQSFYNWLIVFPCLAFGTWGVIFSVLGPDEACAGGSWLSLFSLISFAIVLGKLVEAMSLPPAIGMLTAGLILRNTSCLKFAANLAPEMMEPCRATSEAILLVRGALSVNPVAFRTFKRVAPQLSVLPFLVESTVFSACAYYFLSFSVSWSILTGFTIGTMANAILVPCLNSIQSQLEKSDDAIAIGKTACGLDAIIGICIALGALGFIVSNDELNGGLKKGPLEIIVGGAFGILWGCTVGVLFNASHGNVIRSFAVFSGSVMSMLGLQQIDFRRGGPAGAFCGTLIVAAIWRQKQVDGFNNDGLQESFKDLWFFFQPLLFALIGFRTDLNAVDWTFVWKGALCIALSLAIRVITATTLTSCYKLSWKQRVFIALSWVTKGTVQAALGTVALDAVTAAGFGFESQQTGLRVLHLCILSTFMSSVGYLCLALVGKRLLS